MQEPNDGALFMGTTVNSFRNVSFDNNVYFAAGAPTDLEFPCAVPISALVPGAKLDVRALPVHVTDVYFFSFVR